MNIKPLYKSGNKVLVGLDEDFREVCLMDGLVMIVDLDSKVVIHPPWSGQKILMKGDYVPIMTHQKNKYRQKIRKVLRKRKIAEIEKQLRGPSEEAIDSLIWKPERFEKSNY
ncbi:MAG TPA: hypothetical protein ENH59_10955 [Bacteroidetes bacterium]|nr:hypothetical protein [Bacteroidota bacterium]